MVNFVDKEIEIKFIFCNDSFSILLFEDCIFSELINYNKTKLWSTKINCKRNIIFHEIVEDYTVYACAYVKRYFLESFCNKLSKREFLLLKNLREIKFSKHF